MTAPAEGLGASPSDEELAEGAQRSSAWQAGTGSDERVPASATPPEPLERLSAALDQLERLAAVEEQLLRESIRVTRQAVAALAGLAAGMRPDAGQQE